MPASEPLLSSLAVLMGLVAMVADGRNAVPIAVATAGIGLAPSAGAAGGDVAMLVLFAAALVAAVGALVVRLIASRALWAAGLDPSVPVFSEGRALFGPRSIRVLAAAIALPAASWVSFNAPVGAVTSVQGVLLPAAYMWLCGAFRLVVARSLADVVIGAALVGMGGGVAWLVRAGPDAFAGLLVGVAIAPAVTLLSGWLAGRHGRRVSEGT